MRNSSRIFAIIVIPTLILLPLCPICAQEIADQKIKERKLISRNFQIALFPGISTNGLNSGSFDNFISLNIFSGLSGRTSFFELGSICNVNLNSQTGIQIAGLANIVGANAFINLDVSQERGLLNKGLTFDSKGIVLSGMINFVRHDATGIYLTGGTNFAGRDFRGLQVAGLGNTVKGTSNGVQIAGLFNNSEEGLNGTQVSTLINNTNGSLYGLQVGLLNHARSINGKKTKPQSPRPGYQIGLFNFCKETDGLQIGLVNFGGKLLGKQIGLINFFNRNGTKEKMRNGTPIGLLNFGSKGSAFRAYASELFPFNVEYTTGNCSNCTYVIPTEMPYDDRNKIYNQNALVLSYDLQQNWAFGYGFQKNLFNKASMMPTPANEKRMMAYGVTLIHLNRNATFDDRFNLLTRIHFQYGVRFLGGYIFVGGSLNHFLQQPGTTEIYDVGKAAITTGKIFNLNSSIWPGYLIGFQI